MKLSGKIVGADSSEKTITIECDGSIRGVTIGAPVSIEIDNEAAPKPQHGKQLISDSGDL